MQVFSYIGLWVQTSAQPKSQDDYHKSDLTGLTGLISSLQALNSEDNTHKFLTQKVTNTWIQSLIQKHQITPEGN